MKIVQKEILLSGDEYYAFHLRLVNCFLDKRLSNKEIDILSAFMSLDVGDRERFSGNARRVVFNKLGKTLETNISSYLSSMLKKGVLFKENGMFNVSKFMFPDDRLQGYQFKIVNNGRE